MNASVLDDDTLRIGRLLHYAGLGVVLIVGAAAYSWMYTPVEEAIFDVEMQIVELQQSKQNAEAVQREHARLSQRLEGIANRYTELQRRVPGNAEAGSFLKDVSRIAREEQLTINSFQPSHTVEHQGFASMEVMLNGTGSFAGICSFFERLAKIRRLSKVKDLAITIDDPNERYPMKATLIIYFGLQGETAEEATARG